MLKTFIPKKYPVSSPVRIGEVTLGAGNISWIVGAPFVDSVDQMLEFAEIISDLGGSFFRARAYWPSAKEQDFQRHLRAGLKLLKATAKHFNLLVVSEILSLRDLELMSDYCDVIEVTPRDVSYRELLLELGYQDKVVLLNRPPMMHPRQFLINIHYLEHGGRCPILLGESGIRGFDYLYRSYFDLSLLKRLRRISNHPLFLNCSEIMAQPHPTQSVILAALKAGADGFLGELQQERSVTHTQTALTRDQIGTIVGRLDSVEQESGVQPEPFFAVSSHSSELITGRRQFSG